MDKKKKKTSSLLLSGPFAHKVAFDEVMKDRASVVVRVCGYALHRHTDPPSLLNVAYL